MLAKSAPRWFAGLGVVGALIATTAIPAAAQAAAQVSLFFSDTTVAAGGPGKVDSVFLFATGPVVLDKPVVTFDATDLAGVVEIEDESLSSYCEEPSPGVLRCQDPFEIELDEDTLAVPFSIVMTAAPGATDGDEGTLKVTLTAPGIDAVSHEARLRVGEGVDLAAGDNAEVSAAPGAAFTAPLRVRNIGDTTAEGAVAIFYNDYGFQAAQKYSNCTYDGDEVRICTFDGDLAAGADYGVPFAYRLRADTYAPGSQFGEVGWMTPAEYEDLRAYLDKFGIDAGQPGDGPKLELSQVVGAQARGRQADTDPFNNWSYVEVKATGENGADLEAIGAEFDGEAGTTTDVELKVVNNGPAVRSSGRGGETITRVKVVVPSGTTAVAAPEECHPTTADDNTGEDVDWEHPGKAGAPAYFCDGGLFLAVDETLAYPFTFRIDEVIADAAGAITVNAPCECPTFGDDLDKSNDTAKILVNGTGGGGGGLPVTGASTGIVAGAGALLLAAGVAGFVIARRRRMRFVA
ncbi:LPXTG cell wall anchor domain-containing protein [Phytohabitans kaempferiae]|uniref:LPXTG cell wall anchor domain-containing protein n=1 Tax=Phytohabitans kaempferiae TaxID=1620943 RepID=A0ABV6M1Q6_9ACTN